MTGAQHRRDASLSEFLTLGWYAGQDGRPRRGPRGNGALGPPGTSAGRGHAAPSIQAQLCHGPWPFPQTG